MQRLSPVLRRRQVWTTGPGGWQLESDKELPPDDPTVAAPAIDFDAAAPLEPAAVGR